MYPRLIMGSTDTGESITSGDHERPATAICTIASKNYLAHVRVLADSFRRYHPDVPIYFLLCDRRDGYYDPAAEPFKTVELAELPIKNLPGMCFQYSCLELNTAVKPFLLAHLFERFGLQKLLYFDPDIKFYNPITPLFDALEGAAIILIPHLSAPLLDQAKPTELEILRAGAYNLGFIGVARGPTVARLLPWWQEKLYKHCLVSFDAGYFVDQRWMDLAPGMFDGVRVIRDPAYDVAYWNLQHRRFTRAQDCYLVNGEPLRFYHFSGFDLDRPQEISKHQNRYRLQEVPCLAELFADYEADLKRHGYDAVRDWPYAFATFDDGTVIPALAREIYREFPYGAEPFGDPFRTGPGSFLAWLNEPAEGTGGKEPVITRMAYEIYRRRPDAQQAFPQVAGGHREAFLRWIANDAVVSYNLDRPFAEALKLPKRQVRLHDAQAPQVTATTRDRSWRTVVVGSLARLGVGRLGRRLLGQQFTTRIRDRLRWGWAPTQLSAAPAPQTPTAARTREVTGPFGANVIGFLSSESGVGEAARAIIRGLRAAGVPVAGVTADLFCGHRKRDLSLGELEQGNPYPFNIMYMNADVMPRVLTQMGDAFHAGKYNIGCWAWELERFPQEWLGAFDYVDEVWVPSSFAQDSLARVSPVPVMRMPHAIEVTALQEPPPDVLEVAADCFVFLFIFDYHSFAERKHPLGTLRAFQSAFSERDNVHLVIKATDSQQDPAYHQRLLREARPGQVTVIDTYLDRPVINGLLQRCNCYVSLHRAEGFGLTIAEAMYLGRPVIVTAYSGNLDFTHIDNSYLVPRRLIEISEDHGPYKQGWKWADPDLHAAAQAMRWVYEHPEEAAQVGARGAQEMRTRFSPAAVGDLARGRLELLARRHGASAPEKGA